MDDVDRPTTAHIGTGIPVQRELQPAPSGADTAPLAHAGALPGLAEGQGQGQVMQTTPLVHDEAPREARRAVAACCEQAGAGTTCCDSAQLMTSEVVTNAMIHGTGEVTLGVACGGTRLRVEVGDDNNQSPLVREGDDTAEGGRGMLIVDALAEDWGVDTTPDGKTVWFEVPTHP